MIPAAALEDVVILGDPERTIPAGVSEGSPATTTSLQGQTDQVITLLVNPDEELWPPQRVRVRGRECRVLGFQSVPWPGMGALVTCSRVNPELPDLVRLVRRTRGELDEAGKHPVVDELIWEGEAHIVSGVPWVVDSGGDETTLNKLTITLPLNAPYEDELLVIIDEAARFPAMRGIELTLMGEVLDSSGDVRRVVGYRAGGG